MGIKNINKGETLILKDEINYCDGQIVSKTLAQNEHVSITLFAFEKGEEISTHSSGGDFNRRLFRSFLADKKIHSGWRDSACMVLVI